MKPRVGGEIVYFLVVAMSLLLRISQGVGVDDALGVDMSLPFKVSFPRFRAHIAHDRPHPAPRRGGGVRVAEFHLSHRVRDGLFRPFRADRRAILPGIFEEFVHRGMLSTTFRDSGGKFIFVSALLFALMHQNILQFAHTFVLGLILACIVYCTGSVFPAMFVHRAMTGSSPPSASSAR